MSRRVSLSTGTLNSNAWSFSQREPSLLDRQYLKRRRIALQFCGDPVVWGQPQGAQSKGQSFRFASLQTGPLKANDPTLLIVIGSSGACHQRVATFVEVRTVPWRFPSVLGGVSASRGEWDRVCERPPARAAPLRLKPPQSHPRNHRAWVTAHAPGCAKTRAFNLLVESSSQFGQSEN